jgi:hypothetical protein
MFVARESLERRNLRGVLRCIDIRASGVGAKDSDVEIQAGKIQRLSSEATSQPNEQLPVIGRRIGYLEDLGEEIFSNCMFSVLMIHAASPGQKVDQSVITGS